MFNPNTESVNENSGQQCENPVEKVLTSGNIIELTNHTRLHTEVYLLEHSHRFFEFKDLYKDICSYNKHQNEWFAKRNQLSLKEYFELINTWGR
jgi:hypothetical protein